MTSTTLHKLEDYGVLSVVGARGEQLLQGQITQDVQALELGAWRLGAACNLQGRIVANFAIYKAAAEVFELILPKSAMPALQEAWRKFLPFFKVELQASDAEVYGYLGSEPQLEQHLQLRAGFGLGIGAQTETKASADAWHQQRLQHSWHFVNSATCGKHTAHALGLENLGFISFDKGCYLGQEIVARMHYRGKVKSRVYTLSCAATALAENNELRAEGETRCLEIVETYQLADTALVLAVLPVASHASTSYLLNDQPTTLISTS